MFPHGHKVLQTGVKLVQNPLLAVINVSNRTFLTFLSGTQANSRALLYLVDIFCHLVDLFSSRHFSSLSCVLLLPLYVFLVAFRALHLTANRNPLKEKTPGNDRAQSKNVPPKNLAQKPQIQVFLQPIKKIKKTPQNSQNEIYIRVQSLISQYIRK